MKKGKVKNWNSGVAKGIFSVLMLGLFAMNAKAQEDFIDIKAGYFQYDKLLESNVEPGMVHEGKFRDGVQWKDESGLNSLLLCYDIFPEQGKRDIYVYQYRKVGNQLSMVWEVQDFGGELCEMTFVDNSLQILDFDFDGTMEVGFMYLNVCDGLDPQVTKLMLLKDGKKLVISGKFTPDTHVESEKVIDLFVAQYPAIYKNFMLKIWKEYKMGELEYTNYSLDKADGFLVLQREYMMASGGTAYEIFDLNGLPMRTVPDMETKIKTADYLDIMPDRKGVLVATTKGVSVYDPLQKIETALVTFLETTEAISSIAWSPDKSKIAFTTLNAKEYPKDTRIFVLTLAGNTLAKKEKYDAALMYMAASNWVVEAPRFVDNHTLEYEERIVDDEGPRPGKVKQIVLD